MQRSEIITFIRTVPLFVELDQPQLDQLADATELRSFDSGDIVVDQDHAANELFIVVEGELQAVVGDRHLVTEKELTRLYPGDYFGVVSFFTGAVNKSVVRALESGRMLVLKRSAIDGLFESSPAFARTICRSLAASVTQSLDRVPTVPMVRLDQFRNIAAANSILPKKIARTCQCLVVERDDHQAKVAMVDPHDARARSFLSSVLSAKQLEFVAITDEDFERVAPRYLAESAKRIAEDEFAGTLNFINSQGESGTIDDAGSDLLPRALIAAIRDRASDIHIEPGLPTGRVRLRVDGRLLSFEENVPSNIIRQLISRVKVMSELNITNVRRPQDGRFVVVAGDQRVEMRAASIPCHGGEKVVLRLNAPDDHLSSLANLVVFESVQTFVEDILNQPSGLVLVTGPGVPKGVRFWTETSTGLTATPTS